MASHGFCRYFLFFSSLYPLPTPPSEIFSTEMRGEERRGDEMRWGCNAVVHSGLHQDDVNKIHMRTLVYLCDSCAVLCRVVLV